MRLPPPFIPLLLVGCTSLHKGPRNKHFDADVMHGHSTPVFKVTSKTGNSHGCDVEGHDPPQDLKSFPGFGLQSRARDTWADQNIPEWDLSPCGSLADCPSLASIYKPFVKNAAGWDGKGLEDILYHSGTKDPQSVFEVGCNLWITKPEITAEGDGPYRLIVRRSFLVLPIGEEDCMNSKSLFETRAKDFVCKIYDVTHAELMP